MNAYDRAFGFFRLLSEQEASLPGGKALLNLSAPLLLSNALWFPKPGGIEPAAGWYAERGVEPAVVVPASRDEEMQRALDGGPYELAQGFLVRGPEPAEAAADEVVVEQVSWAQGRVLASVLAAHYGMPEAETVLGKALTAAMQRSPVVLGYVAYRSGTVGAMVLHETPGMLLATLLGGERGPLEARLVSEAAGRGLEPLVLEVLSQDVGASGARTFERWSIC